MRKGQDAKIIYDKHGQIFAVATGVDACTEHECGSKRLMDALCGDKNMLSDEDVVTALRRGNEVVYPSLIERKRIVNRLSELVFEEGIEDGQNVAVLGFATSGMQVIKPVHRELRAWNKEDVVGAWSEDSFAIKVYGTKLVNKLRAFAEKVRYGKALFAGSFLPDTSKESISGVMIALEPSLRPEHRQAIAKAQSKWEADMRLKAQSRVDELNKLAYSNKPHAQSPGFMWPVWKEGKVDGEIMYALNPSYGVDAQYWGPYTFDQLREWILADKKSKLRPLQLAA